MPLTRSQRRRVGDEVGVVGEGELTIVSRGKKGQDEPANKLKDQRGEDEEEEESGSDDSSSDDDSGESSSGSESESESESEEDDLDALFEKSVASLRAKDELKNQKGLQSNSFDDNEDLVRLDNDDVKNTQPNQQQKKNRGSRTGIPDKQVESAMNRLQRGEELGDQKPKSMKQKQREARIEREKTAGSKWFGMPAFPGANRSNKNSTDERSLINPKGFDGDGRGPTEEEMRREVQAIRLRNAIDPKRFYRGSVKGDREMPKYAQLGKIISGTGDAASTMTREARGKTVIEELMKDNDNTAYAKRKYDEQQAKSNVGWSSHVRRHQKRKRGGVSGGKR